MNEWINALIANTIFNNEKWKAFPLSLGITQECPYLSLLFRVVLIVLIRGIRQGKEVTKTN